jgi:uncharacterized protein (TIGR03435 family)
MKTAHELEARNYTLKVLVAAAFNLSPKAVAGGPSWVDSEHFDILAKSPGERRPTQAEQMAMLRQLIMERFQVTFHREEKEMPVFALSLSKGGSKLQSSTLDPDALPQGPPLLAFSLAPGLVRLPAKWVTIAELADVMQRAALDRPVIDKTGLTGHYDFDLEFAPDESLFGGALGKGPDDGAKPGLFSALREQLGLQLEATRGPVSIFVFDRASLPSEN